MDELLFLEQLGLHVQTFVSFNIRCAFFVPMNVFECVLKIEQNVHTHMFLLCSEWVVNQHRDSFASYIGHHNLMEFFSIAHNESKARVKFNFLQVTMF